MACCRYLHTTSTVAVDSGGTNLVLTFSDSPTATNQDRFCFRIAQTIPTAGLALPVQVTVNSAAVPLLDRYGNTVLGASLAQNRLYKGYYGASTAHVLTTSLPAKTCNRCNCS